MESAPQVGRVLPFVLYLSSRNTHKVLVSQRGNSYWKVVLIFSFFFFKYRNWFNTAERPETVGPSTDCGLLAVAGEQKYCANSHLSMFRILLFTDPLFSFILIA